MRMKIKIIMSERITPYNLFNLTGYCCLLLHSLCFSHLRLNFEVYVVLKKDNTLLSYVSVAFFSASHLFVRLMSARKSTL